MEKSKTLYLTLRKDPFDQIKNGEKTSEFREYKKHWIQKLMNKDGSFRSYDFVLFKNGYHKNAPQITVEFKGIKIITEGFDWMSEDKFFEIVLGKIIHLKNV
jgi:hypothetical protein